MKKFGTFSGVFVPSFEALFGAVLFILLPGLVAKVGFLEMAIIVVLANSITIATAFSIGDCASNLENVGAGGMYAIAKRSLGKAFGGAIGIQLFLAQAVSIGFYVVAFAMPLQPILNNIPAVAEFFGSNGISVLQQQQIIATILGIIAFSSGLIGANFVSKIQLFIFVILIFSVGSILFTPLLGMENEGMKVFSKTVNENLPTLSFIAAFTMFFPAATGIDAGVGMSGSLKNPRKSLAKGTFLAIAITAIGYLLVSYIFSLINPELILDENNKEVMRTAAEVFSSNKVITVLILFGIFFATGSSALAYFLTSPRTAQALAKDNILPKFLSFLGKDFKKGGTEPRWATVLTFLIIVPIIWSGGIEMVSTIVAICFLVVYGWINLAAFLERISGNPSFRPTSKGHWLISLYGFLSAMIVIFIYKWKIGIVVFALQLIIFLLLLKFKSNNQIEGVWWGLQFKLLASTFRRMRSIIQGSKNWRPIVGFFCFADKEKDSLPALEMGRWISSYKGISLVNVLSPIKKDEITRVIEEHHQIVNVKDDQYDVAINSIAQSTVPGGLEMNTVFLPMDSRLNLFSLIEDLMKANKNVLLFKPGSKGTLKSEDRIDIWWKGEENGNFMALLSYIIILSDREEGRKKRAIRIIRKLYGDETEAAARKELEELLRGARLAGDILILPEDDDDIDETMGKHSNDASLILIGMPGERLIGLARLFALDERFFTKQLHKYDKFPPVLFVKAADTMSLIE